ncbi:MULTISPECIES: hypothetical protein [unclassified Microcoleus]|uniref:hypothetical protein n=1 Tax=unclassified Microcoleus TaxID=2642155 RepID=UPI002FCE6C19
MTNDYPSTSRSAKMTNDYPLTSRAAKMTTIRLASAPFGFAIGQDAGSQVASG